MATNNYQVFDAAGSNMTTDENYNNDKTRLNGAINGPADPFSFNKALHQATMVSTAIAQFMASNGISCDDTNLTNLVNAIAQCFVSVGSVTYADRAARGLLGAADIGALAFCPAQPVPTPATYAAGSAGNLIGNYRYREVLISGYKNMDGTFFVSGFSPAAQRTDFDVAPSSQQVSITNLPLGTVGCIGRAIYRSVAGGAAGSEKYCGVIWDNTTTTFTDNLTDLQIGAGMPTVQGTPIPADVPEKNTTGTTLSAAQIAGAVQSATLGGADVPKSGSQLQIPMPTADQVGAMRSGIASPSGVNLGSVTVAGSYALPASVIDGPPDGSANSSQLLVIRGSGQTITQIIGSYSSGILWTRSGNVVSNQNGTWSNWAMIPGITIAQDVPGDHMQWHYRVYQNGDLHVWGYTYKAITVNTPMGSGYADQGENINFNTNMFISINTASVGASDIYRNHLFLTSGINRVWAESPYSTDGQLVFDVFSPVAVSNYACYFNADIWGKWK